MPSKAKVTPQKEPVLAREGPETLPDRPLLDLSEAAIKKLIRSAKMRGYVTHDQINSLSKGVNSEQIEDVLAMFSEMGVNVIETEAEKGEEQREEADEEPESEGSELVEGQQKVPAMIAGLCESPLTFQAIIIWRDELNDGKVFLRDIIDLEAHRLVAGLDALGDGDLALARQQLH